MNLTGTAPARQPVPELPEHDLPIASGPEETSQASGSSVAHLRLLWEHRRLLARVVLYGLFASTLIAFLIPTRYESTARLMPPDSSQTGGLAMAAATLSGGAGGLGSIASRTGQSHGGSGRHPAGTVHRGSSRSIQTTTCASAR
jgi:hypothetical protein